MRHWVNNYIGRPWGKGAQGPDAYDCYGLARDVMLRHYGVSLPPIDEDCTSLLKMVRALSNHPGWSLFEEVDTPRGGDLVKMIKYAHPDHVGVWVDIEGGGVLHAMRGHGVVFDTPILLNAVGWVRLGYFRFRGTDA